MDSSCTVAVTAVEHLLQGRVRSGVGLHDEVDCRSGAERYVLDGNDLLSVVVGHVTETDFSTLISVDTVVAAAEVLALVEGAVHAAA